MPAVGASTVSVTAISDRRAAMTRLPENSGEPHLRTHRPLKIPGEELMTDDEARCIHCHTLVFWVSDPSSDLCKNCAWQGLLSPLWDAARAAEHEAFRRRIPAENNDF